MDERAQANGPALTSGNAGTASAWSPCYSARMVRVAVAAVCALFLAAGPALATSIPELSPRELAARSDLVGVFRVVSHESAWVGRRIITFYQVDVEERWQTAADTTAADQPLHVVIALPGGVVGDIGQRVAGTPLLEDGQRYVACLGHDVGPRGGRAIIGLWQGLWRVGEDGLLTPFHHDAPSSASSPQRTIDDVRAALLQPRSP